MDAKRPPGWACVARGPRESIPSPGRCPARSPRSGCSRGGGSSALRYLLRGPRRLAGAARRSAAGPFSAAAAARPMAQTRRALARPARPRLPEPGGKARMLRVPPMAGIQCPAPPLSPRGSCPRSRRLPWPGGFGVGGGSRLVSPSPWGSSSSRCSCFQMHPEWGLGAPHPQLHASRSEIWAIRGGRRGGWLQVPGSERQELTCKQAVFLGSGLLDHDVDILLNSLLP